MLWKYKIAGKIILKARTLNGALWNRW